MEYNLYRKTFFDFLPLFLASLDIKRVGQSIFTKPKCGITEVNQAQNQCS